MKKTIKKSEIKSLVESVLNEMSVNEGWMSNFQQGMANVGKQGMQSNGVAASQASNAAKTAYNKPRIAQGQQQANPQVNQNIKNIVSNIYKELQQIQGLLQ